MSFPSTLRLKSEPSIQNQQSLPSTLKLKNNQPQLSEKIDFSSQEEDEREIERAQAQLTSRGLESFLGAPGDIASFLTGMFGKEQEVLPTSKKLREFSEKSSLGYTKPKNEFEEDIGNIVSDVASMAIPGSGHYSFARNIGIPIVGGLIKEGLKYNNSSEKSQAYGKVGSMIALDLISRRSGGVKKYVDTLYKKADQSLPKGVSVKASGLDSALTKLEETLSAGGSRPTTKKSLEKLNEIRKEIKNDKIDIKRLAAYRPSINEAIEEIGGFNFEIPKKLKPQTIRNLNQVKSEVIKTLDQYGEKFNPEFLKYNKSANEAYAAMQKSNVIANFIKDKVPYTPQSKSVQALFSYAPVAGAAALGSMSPVSGAAAIGGAGAYQGFKVLHRVMNSPTLRKYYLNVLKESTAGNISQTSKNLKALDIAIDEKDDRPREGKKSSEIKTLKKK
jgi:hypothetical protein